jgi:hypothetical protein
VFCFCLSVSITGLAHDPSLVTPACLLSNIEYRTYSLCWGNDNRRKTYRTCAARVDGHYGDFPPCFTADVVGGTTRNDVSVFSPDTRPCLNACPRSLLMGWSITIVLSTPSEPTKCYQRAAHHCRLSLAYCVLVTNQTRWTGDRGHYLVVGG